ncbi:PilZ domain-containing protein [endosymbiont of Ridgeia piscesae]|uniref:PilZ domain n=1 Tax=endosymbiont of Ridgeia piscesae TaxID=54398 RepID=A0A0T5Z1F9_9GAMM|nr:PilZ domain-containing protein [endosymbiont of Ridgeia piscesae]KRT56667.1 PilZ domain [endosymbiont of Ridgeia piscesae]KRT57833.1 PilZ domain-containing protein [endosymbiont of Ridgeia piscesae]
MDARAAPRSPLKVAVNLFCEQRASQRHCVTHDISTGGFFAVGVLCLRPGDRLKVALGEMERGALSLNCRVIRVSMEGAGLKFEDNSALQMEALSEIILPNWDGKSLLEGQLRIAPWYPHEGLSGWLRLMSLLNSWHLLATPARMEFRRCLKNH